MNESEPVDDGEFVFRRIHPDFYDPSLPLPVQGRAFRPSHNDDTGLSVLRARFAQPKDCLANADPAKVAGYAVARLAVQDLRKLGLTVNPEPLPAGPPGHAVIPELSWQNYNANKKRCRPILAELAKLASADIVHRAL
jgi:hypothetical protein